jgi:hypothetical protein
MKPELLSRLTRRVECLEEAARHDAERVAAYERQMRERLDTPEGRALRAEYDLVCERLAKAYPDAWQDPALRRQLFVSDVQASDLVCRMLEFQAG